MNPLARWFRRSVATTTARPGARHPTWSRRRWRLHVVALEDRLVLSTTAAGFEPIGGTGNNLAHPSWGAAGTDLLRISPVAYANGVSSPSQPNSLSPAVHAMPVAMVARGRELMAIEFRGRRGQQIQNLPNPEIEAMIALVANG